MYSPAIIDRRLHQAKKNGLLFKRLARDTSLDISSKLEQLRFDRTGHLLPPGQLSRPLNNAEEQFIDSERLLCKCDFWYFIERYFNIELDPGVTDRQGIGSPLLLESQRRMITLMGRREDACHEEQKKYKFTSGILAYVHKVRQICATTTFRAATLHRMLLWPGTRAFAASFNDVGCGELFKRDHISLDTLPFWLKPRLYPDVKDTEIGFEPPINSRITYQAENQKTGIGTGTQQDVSHLTEVALWHLPGRIRYSFVPSIPKALTTLHVQESTSDGRGDYWNEVTEACRARRAGYEDWIYIFIPWWMNKTKYRANVPDEWTPEDNTLKHADLIERSSPEFYDGKTYRPTRDQLYWWEKTRAMYASNGELASFLTNYPATPEQSFQGFSDGALPVELLEVMEQEAIGGVPYDLELASVLA